jgi:hypothetical protein
LTTDPAKKIKELEDLNTYELLKEIMHQKDKQVAAMNENFKAKMSEQERIFLIFSSISRDAVLMLLGSDILLFLQVTSVNKSNSVKYWGKGEQSARFKNTISQNTVKHS